MNRCARSFACIGLPEGETCSPSQTECATERFGPCALQGGILHAEVVAPKLGDLHQSRGYDSLLCTFKGGHPDALAIHLNIARLPNDHPTLSGDTDDSAGLSSAQPPQLAMHATRQKIGPNPINRVLRKHLTTIGLRRDERRSMFITTALNNSRSQVKVRRALCHSEPGVHNL